MRLICLRTLCLPLVTATGRHLSLPKTCRHLSLPNTGRLPALLNTAHRPAINTGRYLSLPNTGRLPATNTHLPGPIEAHLSNATRAQFCSKLSCMEYREIRYALRAGIERGKWFVAIYPDEGVEMAGKKVLRTREDAETHAHHMIDRWLDSKSRQRSKLER
jgi:hypothetical protein